LSKCIHLGLGKGKVKLFCNVAIAGPKYSDVSECGIHTRCIPNFKPTVERLEAWNKRSESELYTICDICGDRQETKMLEKPKKVKPIDTRRYQQPVQIGPVSLER
jgi:hypothetical protein